MQLSRSTDYALRVLIYLACQGGGHYRSTRSIARLYGISEEHLRKVTGELVAQGWLEARRGQGGGVRLVLAPEELTVGRVVRALERLDLLDCFEPAQGNLEPCLISPTCELKGVLRDALEAFLEVLDQRSLAEVAASPRLRRLFRSAAEPMP